jgi:hypothetical protein
LRIVQEKPDAAQKKFQDCGPHIEGAAIHYAFVAEHGTWPKELKPRWNSTVEKCEAACRESPDCGGWSFRWGQPHHLHHQKCFLYSPAVTSWFELRPTEERQDPEKYFVSGLCSKRESHAAVRDKSTPVESMGSNASVTEEVETVVTTNRTEGSKIVLEAPSRPSTTTGKSTAITALLGTLNQHRGITIFDSEFQIKVPTSAGVKDESEDQDVESDASGATDDSTSDSSSSSSSSSLAIRATSDVMASPAGYQKRWKSASMWKFDDEGELPGRNTPKTTGYDRRGQYFDGSSAPVRPIPMRYLA